MKEGKVVEKQTEMFSAKEPMADIPVLEEETATVVQSKRPKKAEAVRSAPPKKKKEEDKEASKQKDAKADKAKGPFDLDGLSDKVSDWDDKPKDK